MTKVAGEDIYGEVDEGVGPINRLIVAKGDTVPVGFEKYVKDSQLVDEEDLEHVPDQGFGPTLEPDDPDGEKARTSRRSANKARSSSDDSK